MTLLELSDPMWQDFVQRHPAATAFHHPDWARSIADCYGFRVFAIVTTDDEGTIRAGLPVMEVRHVLGRPRWVSLPFTDYCPPLVSTIEDEDDLARALREASETARVRHVEVRGPLAGAVGADTPALRHVLALDPDPAVVYSRFSRTNVKQAIRRAERERLTLRVAQREADLVDTFYGLHVGTRRRQGVPVQSRRFFRILWERVVSSGLGSVLIVEASGRPIAGGVFLSWNGTVIHKYEASDRDAWALRPNHLLMWHAIRTACEDGYRWFDFGRTDADNESLSAFKRTWGADEEPLIYRQLGPTPKRHPASHRRGARVLGALIRHGPPMLCRATGTVLYRYVA